MTWWPRTGLGRLGLAFGALLGAFACLPLTSARASFANGEFIITPFGSTTPVTLQYAQLQGLTPDVPSQTYQVIATPGATASSVTVNGGYSLEEILNAAGLATSNFDYAEVSFGSAESTLLSAALATASPTSSEPPVFYENGTTMNFADQSPSGYISGSALVYVNLYPGPELTVTAKASPSAIKAGQDVNLTATVSNQPPGATLKYQWDDGTGLTYGFGSPLRHPFAIPGTYYAYATVVGTDGSVGISPPISFEVGKVPKGPKRNGGGTSKKKKAPTSGPGTKGSANGKSTTGKGKASEGNATAGNGNTGANTAATTTTSATTARPAVKQQASPHVAAKTPPRRSGPLLSGIAVTDVRSQASSAPKPAVAPAGAANPARTGHQVAHDGAWVSEGLWIALGTLAAVLGGAGLEWSGRPRRWPSLRPLIARFR